MSKAKRRIRKKIASKELSKAYRLLSKVNTVATLVTLDPKRIGKHLIRKSLFRALGKLLR